MAKGTSTVAPNLGLYLGRPGTTVPVGGLEAGNNFRLKQGRINNHNLGWVRWDDYTLNGPVMKMFRFILRAGTQRILYFTLKDIYLYNDVALTVSYLTPRYETGTVAINGGSATLLERASGPAATGSATTAVTRCSVSRSYCTRPPDGYVSPVRRPAVS
jgi:hypothetical protein